MSGVDKRLDGLSLKMPVGMQVGLGPSDIVLDGDAASFLPKGGGAPIFGPYLLWPNGWMDKDATWFGGRPQPKRHCIRWGPSSRPPKGGGAPNFRPIGLMGHGARR